VSLTTTKKTKKMETTKKNSNNSNSNSQIEKTMSIDEKKYKIRIESFNEFDELIKVDEHNDLRNLTYDDAVNLLNLFQEGLYNYFSIERQFEDVLLCSRCDGSCDYYTIEEEI
jgi:hypothetical protein